MAVCPCGKRIERKQEDGRWKETEKQFLARKYCNCDCKGRYHSHKPAVNRRFGDAVPKDKGSQRVGPGFEQYLGGGMMAWGE